MEHDRDLDAFAAAALYDLDALAMLHRAQADFQEQIRLSTEAVEQSQDLLRRIDEQLAKSPLKP